MSFAYPWLLPVAVLVSAVAVAAYVQLHRRQAAALARSGLGVTGGSRGRLRRQLPVALFLAALLPLSLALTRPQATVGVPRVAGTVVLAVDVSNSMTADDVAPTRLGAAQRAAREFVQAQPETLDIGLVAFGQAALVVQAPTADRDAVVAAIDRLSTGGGTSLGTAILAALSTIVGQPVTLPADGEPAPDLGYWGSASIVVLSDGEETGGGVDTEAAAVLAAAAGVRIETVGVGTTGGARVEVDGYQLATALDERLLTAVAQVSGGTYHRPQDTEALHEVHRAVELRVTTRPEAVELTSLLAATALLLLIAGGLLMIRRHGRIV
ncbi:VWA domain-containing protein [Micromonospora endophytica]|uniref:Uncharacterized protein n=1 Tax=Micromonospora endophytica TaxID=515350 RepID=A0A2W2C9S0_9ACTN|nr:VWA domain-containing protein [Micromonospora endophytica]PZF96195.1 hypothetical protein C1I93_14345 [Micromonospora endophytica]RIW43505.1 VWA domain-containing protein [Micromonospora endophytica]BCJ62865.1 hypothetical protein Jiend_62870 [Micromonospora endophytica]